MITSSRAKQRQIYQDIEKIKETGQDSDLKARSVISTLFKQEQLKEVSERTNFLTLLDFRRKYNDYNEQLAKILVHYLKEEDLDRNIGFKVFFDTKGVIMHIFYQGRTFQRAFKAERKPSVDLNACKVFAISASSLISKLKNKENVITAKSQ